MVVITGDLFDGMDGNLQPPVKPFDNLQTKEAYFITGNHEIYLGVSQSYSALAGTQIKILNNEVVNLNGLRLIGISYPSGNESAGEAAVLKKLQPEFSGRPNIVLYHAPVNVALAQALGVNLQLSGHTHRGQIWL